VLPVSGNPIPIRLDSATDITHCPTLENAGRSENVNDEGYVLDSGDIGRIAVLEPIGCLNSSLMLGFVTFEYNIEEGTHHNIYIMLRS
jgi:hypothetical protein